MPMENTVDRSRFTYPETLCWFCDNALGGCCWAESFTPVPGWDATPTRKNGDDSFLVTQCPEYIPDRAAKEAAKPRGETVPAKGFSKEAEEAFLWGVRRGRARKHYAAAKRFLSAVDKGSSVSTAAAKAGISLATAYGWLKILRGETTR